MAQKRATDELPALTGDAVPPARGWRDKLPPPVDPTPRTIATVVILSLVVLAAIIVLPPLLAGTVLLLASAAYVFRRYVFNWTVLLFVLAAVIMFIPMRRYALPIPLPFALEPYRVVMVVLILGLIVAVTRNRFQWRPVAFGWPIGIFAASLLISVIANSVSLAEQGLDQSTIPNLLGLALLISTFFVVRQLLSSERIVMMLLTFLVWAGVVVAFFAVVERLFRVNVFLLLANFLPLVLLREAGESLRAGGARSYASSQHPIALSVALCMLIPIAIFLARYGRRPVNELSRRILYGVAIGFLLAGVLVAVSRTAVVVLVVMLAITLLLMPRLAALLITIALPAAVLGVVLLPKVFETMVGSLLDINSLISSQYASVGFRGQGRLADLAPAFDQAAQNPFFGTGVGSRIVVGPDANSNILDNQVLGTLLDAGVIGIIGLIAFLIVPGVMLLVFAFRTRIGAKYAHLAFAIAVSIAGYIAAMFFYDAFSFMQTFLILDMLLAVGAWVLTEAGGRWPRPVARGADAVVASPSEPEVAARGSR